MLLAAAALAGVGLAGWLGGRLLLRRDDGGPRRNVVLVVIDTCRASHLSCYGYARRTTPVLDSLAAAGTICRAAYSQAPWTLPSFASLFTSQYPSEHGAGGRVGDFRRFDIATRVLAEELLDHGYATAGIANVTWLEPKFRFSKGFEIYDVHTTDATNTGHRTAAATTAAALAAIDRLPEPFFLMVHYFDPHVKYEPPAPYDTLFAGHYDGPYGASFGDADQVLAIRKGTLELDAGARQHLVDLYDGELAFTDAQIGALLAGLGRRGSGDRTLVVVTADHGEEFWEHGGFEHGHSLYEEQIHVPLILSGPGLVPRGMAIETPVQEIDIAPTILELLGYAPPRGFHGSSLLPRLRGGGGRGGRAGRAFAEAVLWGDARASLRVGPYKLIVDLDADAVELYDLPVDPGEEHDLAAEQPELAADLRGQLAEERQAMARGQDIDAVPIDEQTLRRLRALGYTQ